MDFFSITNKQLDNIDLLLDDIHLNVEMKEFWEWIGEEKYDISSIGHITGTGVVYFI